MKFGAAALALCLFAASCNAASPPIGTVDPNAAAIPTWTGDGALPDAVIGGVLSVANGCLVLTPPGDASYLLIWPQGWSARRIGEIVQVRDPAGAIYETGGTYGFGGGEFKSSNVGHPIQDLDPRCERANYWVVTRAVPIPTSETGSPSS
jgi:hypothetical protein